jgi:LysR family glycine cleavage system transcriptional activator
LRRLPLGSLRVFVAVAEELSFTRAALTLGVSVGAVSMQIRALEQYLRAPLFRRSGRLVYLTPDAERLLPRVRAALTELERAIDEARTDRRLGPLTVSVLGSFLQAWLLPRLPDFQRRHPDIDLRVQSSPEIVDFVRSDVQVAIRYGLGHWPPLHVEKLLDDWLVPVCAPAQLERCGPIATRDDLERHHLLHSTTEPWRAWLERVLTGEEWAPRGSSFDDSIAVLRAAQEGHGLALSRWSLAAGEVAAGRLAVASRVLVPAGRAYYFVCPTSYLSIEKIAALREWLVAQAPLTPRPPGL